MPRSAIQTGCDTGGHFNLGWHSFWLPTTAAGMPPDFIFYPQISQISADKILLKYLDTHLPWRSAVRGHGGAMNITQVVLLNKGSFEGSVEVIVTVIPGEQELKHFSKILL